MISLEFHIDVLRDFCWLILARIGMPAICPAGGRVPINIKNANITVCVYIIGIFTRCVCIHLYIYIYTYVYIWVMDQTWYMLKGHP